MKRVDNRELGRIRRTIEEAFPGANALAEVDLALADNLEDERWIDGSIHNMVPGGATTFRVQMQQLLRVANNRGWLPDLLSALRESQPGNTSFEGLLAELNSVAPVSAPKAILQDILPGGAILAFATLERRMRTVCRIDYADRTPPGAGTGFLVGPDLVLTNHHVARRAIESLAGAQQLRFRFDLRSPAAAADNAGRCCAAKPGDAAPVLRSSPPGGVEIQAVGEPSLAELDYALIRLDQAPGNDDVGGGSTRGFRAIAPDMPVPAPATSIIALQHPARGELQFAVGVIDGPNPPGSRVRHNAATLGGSSGSLILDVALGACLLHNGTRPGSAAELKPYNTGVPLRLIAADIAGAGLQLQ